jgi:hypothetical protein
MCPTMLKISNLPARAFPCCTCCIGAIPSKCRLLVIKRAVCLYYKQMQTRILSFPKLTRGTLATATRERVLRLTRLFNKRALARARYERYKLSTSTRYIRCNTRTPLFETSTTRQGETSAIFTDTHRDVSYSDT